MADDDALGAVAEASGERVIGQAAGEEFGQSGAVFDHNGGVFGQKQPHYFAKVLSTRAEAGCDSVAGGLDHVLAAART